MIGEKILGERPVTLLGIKQLLAKRKKEKELTYEQDLTFKYAKRFSKLTEKQYEKLYAELKKAAQLPEEVILKIIDILPDRQEILLLLIPKNVTLDEKAAKEILELTAKYVKK